MVASKSNFEGTLGVTLAGTVAYGDWAVIGGILGMYQKAGVSGDLVPFLTQGLIKDAPKVGSQAWTVGMQLYWDAGNARFTKVFQTTGIRAVAASVVGSGAGETTGDVLLMPGGAGAYNFKAGQHTTVAAADTIVTGLNVVIGVVATLDSDPSDDPEHVSATIGDQAGAPAAGSIIIKTWKNGATDPTPAAATTFSKKVNYIAFGY